MLNSIWKDRSIHRSGFPGWIAVGLRTIISPLARLPVWLWPVGVIVVVTVIAGFLATSQTLTVNADDEQDSTIENCLRCHPRKLEFHDKLGSGNRACWVCHDATDMETLHLADGTPLSLTDSAQLCGQCHQERYQAWQEGTHGLPGTIASERCSSCHDPHGPQIALLDITMPHPAPQPDPSPPTVVLQVILGTVLLLTVALAIVVTRRGEGL